ncbi:MAG: PepSY-associated TM helix domain-containing protein [Burkholderiaceae bacterium]|nr:PepSY-associated TM helix domain-containing protein [Burkholderiaceae bacterium]
MQTEAIGRALDGPASDAVPGVFPAVRPRRRSRRAVFLTWLRKTHLYVGLWGAVLGLLFGATGILLNHRSVMKIPVEKAILRTAQLPLPAQPIGSAEQMADWLRQELKFTAQQVTQVRAQPASVIVWADREVRQPERWGVSLQSPQRGVNAEYFVGNHFVKLDQVDATPIGTLTRLHMSVGVSAFWVLLSDTIASSLILLSITGLLLWTELHTLRTAAAMTSVAALAASGWFLWSI